MIVKYSNSTYSHKEWGSYTFEHSVLCAVSHREVQQLTLNLKIQVWVTLAGDEPGCVNAWQISLLPKHLPSLHKIPESDWRHHLQLRPNQMDWILLLHSEVSPVIFTAPNPSPPLTKRITSLTPFHTKCKAQHMADFNTLYSTSSPHCFED